MIINQNTYMSNIDSVGCFNSPILKASQGVICEAAECDLRLYMGPSRLEENFINYVKGN